MSIRQEISQAVRGLCKQAQAPGFMPKTGNEQVDAYTNLGNLHLLRGIARGAKNVVPGLVDGLIGTGAGLINGAGQWLGGGKFSDGWNESTDFVRQYYSDPIRKAEMAMGGNAVKRMFDSAQKYHQGTIEKQVGPAVDAFGRPRRPYWEYRKALDDMASIEDGVAVGSELAFSAPSTIGPLSKLGKIPTVVGSSLVLGANGKKGYDAARESQLIRHRKMIDETEHMNESSAKFIEAIKRIDPVGWQDFSRGLRHN